jgi:hypothetical protein
LEPVVLVLQTVAEELVTILCLEASHPSVEEAEEKLNTSLVKTVVLVVVELFTQ